MRSQHRPCPRPLSQPLCQAQWDADTKSLSCNCPWAVDTTVELEEQLRRANRAISNLREQHKRKGSPVRQAYRRVADAEFMARHWHRKAALNLDRAFRAETALAAAEARIAELESKL